MLLKIFKQNCLRLKYISGLKKIQGKITAFDRRESVFEQILVNLHNRTEEERRWQILRDKRDNNFV